MYKGILVLYSVHYPPSLSGRATRCRLWYDLCPMPIEDKNTVGVGDRLGLSRILGVQYHSSFLRQSYHQRIPIIDHCDQLATLPR